MLALGCRDSPARKINRPALLVARHRNRRAEGRGLCSLSKPDLLLTANLVQHPHVLVAGSCLFLHVLRFVLCRCTTTTLSLAGCTFICVCWSEVAEDISHQDRKSTEGALSITSSSTSWYLAVECEARAVLSAQARYKEKLPCAGTLERPKDSMEMAP